MWLSQAIISLPRIKWLGKAQMQFNQKDIARTTGSVLLGVLTYGE
ncbi:hypothetical protein [Paenibacillus donghaensis]|nr:hypothetical protein [Paenibacillus donghaensis]